SPPASSASSGRLHASSGSCSRRSTRSPCRPGSSAASKSEPRRRQIDRWRRSSWRRRWKVSDFPPPPPSGGSQPPPPPPPPPGGGALAIVGLVLGVIGFLASVGAFFAFALTGVFNSSSST